jgi:hypothetical protein
MVVLFIEKAIRGLYIVVGFFAIVQCFKKEVHLFLSMEKAQEESAILLLAEVKLRQDLLTFLLVGSNERKYLI